MAGATLLAIAALAAPFAGAQDAETVRSQADTEYTPVAKETDLWQQVAGAEWRPAGEKPVLVPRSPTPVDVDFFAVAFRNSRLGFAGGAQCEAPPAPDVEPAALDEYLAGCRRVPVIYEYSPLPGSSAPEWHQVHIGDEQGYVGGIAFMADGRAIAVGGAATAEGGGSDGVYPRSEPPAGQRDPAGAGRVWVHDGATWEKVDDDRIAKAPNGDMTGLTAVDCSPRVASLCFAGGFRQLFRWSGDEIDAAWSGGDPDASRNSGDLPGAARFKFRVRSLDFWPARKPYVGSNGVKAPEAVAVTSGCCDGAVNRPRPSLLTYDGSGWRVTAYGGQGAGETGDDAAPTTLPDSFYSVSYAPAFRGQQPVVSMVASPGGEAVQAGGVEKPLDERPASRIMGADLSQPSTPLFAILPLGGTGAKPAEPTGDLYNQATDPRLSPIRLLAGDGDTGSRLGLRGPAQEDGFGDGLVDWAVGGLTGALAGRAAAVTTLRRGSDIPSPLACETTALPTAGGYLKLNTNCPIDPAFAESARSVSHYRLDAYTLNAYTYVVSSGVGWAVGDRGGIERLGGGTGSVAGAAKPAKLGGRELETGPDITPYRGLRPATTSEPGVVPPLAARPWEELAAPEMRATGMTDPTLLGASSGPPTASLVVMNRAGTQGFGFGERRRFQRPTMRWNIDFFDGSRWRKCTPESIPGALPSDPMCAGLAELPVSHRIATAARVPYELDADPANDDEFEVVAVVDYRAAKPADVLRFRNGRWTLDREMTAELPAQVLQVAFTGPDDGWLTTYSNQLFRFDGETWLECTPANAEACGDDPARPLIPPKDLGGADKRLALTTVGERVYLYGTRFYSAGSGSPPTPYPVILWREGDGRWTAEDGGFDPLGPGTPSTPPSQDAQGSVASLSVVRTADGGYAGWAVGTFGRQTSLDGADEAKLQDGRVTSLLRLGPDRTWSRWTAGDAAHDYLVPRRGDDGTAELLNYASVVALADGTAYLVPTTEPSASNRGWKPLLRFDGDRWRVQPTPFVSHPRYSTHGGAIRALAADGAGGVWVTAQGFGGTGRYANATTYYRLGRRHHEPVFTEVPHPVRESVTGMAASPEGTIWLSTSSAAVYRYDRLAGWDRLLIKGWDPGKVVTRASSARAVAVGPDGEGLAVGDGGRIANLSRRGVILDAVSGLACSEEVRRGCGTARTLRAAAIGPDGSALVGGDGHALLFREGAEGEFGPVPAPPGSSTAAITGISFPTPESAWLANDQGQVFAGTRAEGDGDAPDRWEWRLENVNAQGDLLTGVDAGDRFAALHAIAIDADGHGYAVGDRGVILERDAGDGWRRLVTGYLDNFHSLAVPPAGGKGAIVGGESGLVLTLVDGRFEVAQPPDQFDATQWGALRDFASKVVGAAILPGTRPGDVEAWVASQSVSYDQRNPAPAALFHYASDPGDPLMNPVRRATPLPDTPAPRPGEIVFAAFGKSDCQTGRDCAEALGSNLAHEAVSRRIVSEIEQRSAEIGGPAFALFTGDMNAEAGTTENRTRVTPLDDDLVHKRWRELVAAPLQAAGVPVFAAVGRQDLSDAGACVPPTGSYAQCSGTREAQMGSSTGWRAAFATMPAPWGMGPAAEGGGGVTYEPVPGQAAPDENTEVANPDDGSRLTTLPTGGARTHYAFDVVRDGKKTARVVVIDTSHQRSLSISDADQNPREADGQNAFVQRMLCTSGPGCTRPAGVPGIVLSNAPTYSFNPGALTDTQADGAALETTLFEQEANLVVSGRLGWNAVYWATAPGLHVPCPGDSYRVDAPRPGERTCDATPAANAPAGPGQAPSAPGAEQLAQTLEGLGAPPPPVDLDDAASGLTGVLPFVIASSAGGKLAADATGKREGFWHGYSVIRMDPSGDPDLTIVEQRPVFDWLQVTGPDHVLKAGQRMRLTGEGREPVGFDQPARYVRIDSPSITHRYDLVLADPRRPYVPARDADGSYVELPPGVASIDRDTGMVTADKGDHERVFAIAILSVGDQAATYPLVFEPKRSFKPRPARVVPPAPLRPKPAQMLRVAPPASQPPPPIVLGATPAKLPPVPPAPPPAAPPAALSIELPAPPALPPIGTAPAAPGVAPPAPPAPPAPAAAPPPAALSLTVSAPGINVSSQGSVIPPPAPPIQPAPPGGARKEARQRQAATAKSESSSDAQSQGGESGGGDGGSNAYTRRETAVERHSFTAVSHRGAEWSPWERGAVYGGGLTLAALLLAMTWTAAGPKARRREPEAPAPAWARNRRWR